ncbi:hypothetical protein Cpir12675_004359 [Ceratocystis pirilliformis]|uniref:Uncharacterized protein n=1 Tax=Ceratocystis pirilliformis TaxID=259994 RepID=A0ABR3YWQ6_9PEZI
MHTDFEPTTLQRPSIDTVRHFDRPVSSLPAFSPQASLVPSPARFSHAHRNWSWPLLYKATSTAGGDSLSGSSSVPSPSLSIVLAQPQAGQIDPRPLKPSKSTVDTDVEARPTAVCSIEPLAPRPKLAKSSSSLLDETQISVPSVSPSTSSFTLSKNPINPASKLATHAAKPLLTTREFSLSQSPPLTACLRISSPDSISAPKSLKRLRPASDVDGTHTRGLSLKKRRLAFQFATSRLSPPFSLPASHILNRELALTATSKLLRMLSPERRLGRARGLGQAVQFRRLVALNWMRFGLDKRSGWVPSSHVVETSGGQAGLGRERNEAKARVQEDSSSTRNPTMKGPVAIAVSSVLYRQPVATSKGELSQAEPLPLSGQVQDRLAEANKDDRHQDEYGHEVDEDEDDDDEDSAFPMASFADRYADEPDDIYSDFSLIFSSGSNHAPMATATQPLAMIQQSPHRLPCAIEEGGCLDEMDGITWAFR